MCIGLTTTLDAIGCVTRLQLLRGLTHYVFFCRWKVPRLAVGRLAHFAN